MMQDDLLKSMALVWVQGDPDDILLLTFTNKAANEMKQRVTELTQNQPGFAGTFHSFCVRVLRVDGENIEIPRDFLIYDEQDSRDAIKQIIVDLNLDKNSIKPQAVSSIISEAKSQMISANQYGEFIKGNFQETVHKIYIEYEKFLNQVGALDFEDLLLKTVRLFSDETGVLAKWQRMLTHVLVDEWQDTNKIQYKLTKQKEFLTTNY